MGHDHHFLERLDRASREETDFALSLYRDHEALRHVLDAARLPEGAERVALEITPGGPHVIVQREGKFITCLGRGMSVGPHPVIARPRIDALLAGVAELRARRKMAKLVERPGEDEGALFGRIVDRADGLSREEFMAISGWQPLLAAHWYRRAFDGCARAIRWTTERPQPGPARDATARQAAYARWKLFWATGHYWLLATMGSLDYLADHVAHLEEQKVTFSGAAMLLSSTRLMMRAWWGVARIGKPLVAVYKQRLAAASNGLDLLDSMMGLAVIGLRHSALRAEMRKAVLAPRKYAEDYLTQNCANLAAALALAFDDPDAHAGEFLELARQYTLERSAHLPEGSPCRFAGAGEVPEDVARAVLLGRDVDLHGGHSEAGGLVVACVGAIARARAEDFYLPREVESRLHVPWTPERTRELLGRSMRHCRKEEPVRAGDKPGRNDPCPCGSGKKHKKCCGS